MTISNQFSLRLNNCNELKATIMDSLIDLVQLLIEAFLQGRLFQSQ